MLEKFAGVALITNLRTILLMKADFNFHNKLIFGKQMMDLAWRYGIVPEEIYSEKGRTAEDAVLHQVLAYNIARQKRTPSLWHWSTLPNVTTGLHIILRHSHYGRPRYPKARFSTC